MLKQLITPTLRTRAISSLKRSTLRFYSVKPQPKKNSVDFKTFITVSIFASIILTQVVDAVNKEKPRGQRDGVSEAEYYKQQQRLKRKIALFSPDQKEVIFLKKANFNLTELNEADIEVVDPLKLVELEKKDKSSKFYDLLNDDELKTLPRGLATELIGKHLKASEKTKFVIVDFPRDVKEAMQFEDKIVTVKRYVSSEETDVFRYYRTVNKAAKVESTEDIVNLF